MLGDLLQRLMQHHETRNQVVQLEESGTFLHRLPSFFRFSLKIAGSITGKDILDQHQLVDTVN
jgi:hypothetical protein